MGYRVLLVGWLHHKNLNALLKYKEIELVRADVLPQSLDSFDIVYCPTTCVDVSLYPGVRFIFGPHFSVFPEASQMSLIRGAVYVQPSSWTVDIWKGYHYCRDIQFRILSFGVDTELFRPSNIGVKKENMTLIGGGFTPLKIYNGTSEGVPLEVQGQRCTPPENVFIYFKRRKPEELEFVENILRFYKVSYRIFSYGSYSESEYIQYLKGAKYGIWLDAHESQGFALEEALSMNVPLLVWNVRFMSQEYRSSYLDFFATTIPYWDPSCGEVVYEWQDFSNVYSMFLNKLDSYRPREFVIKELSIEACERRFLDLIREVIGGGRGSA